MSFVRKYSTTPATAIKTSLVLSRIPIVTPDIPEFEKLFYSYQEQLERRLMWTFPKWYYFKKGTVAEREFTQAQKYPIPSHRGVWFPKGVPDLKHGRDRRFAQEVILPKKHVQSDNIEGAEATDSQQLQDLDDIGRPIKLNSRITKFDESNDQTSLERKLPRTLYLLIKDGNTWKFPSFNVESADVSKGLHQIAEDGLRTIGGDKINTWTVSNTPAALIKYNNKGEIVNEESAPVNEFLIKSHIVAGKFDPTADVKEFKWLAKEEIAELVDNSYYNKISHLLAN